MTVTRKRRKLFLCGGSDTVIYSPRPGSPIEHAQKIVKKPSLRSRIWMFFRERFVFSRIRIRFRKPRKSHLKVCGRKCVQRTVETIPGQKQSFREGPSLYMINEQFGEKRKELSKRKSRSRTKRGVKLDQNNGTDSKGKEDNKQHKKKKRHQSPSLSSTRQSNRRVSQSTKEENNDSLQCKSHGQESQNSNITKPKEKQTPPKIRPMNPVNSNCDSAEPCTDNKSVSRLRSKVKGHIELLPQKVDSQLFLEKGKVSNVPKKEEKGFNTNANSGDADNMKDDFQNATDTGKVTFRREAIKFPVHSERNVTVKHVMELKEAKKDKSMPKEKAHPAVSKKTNRLKSDKNLDAKISSSEDCGRERDNVKKIRQDKKIVKEKLTSENAWGSKTNLTQKTFDEDVRKLVEEKPLVKLVDAGRVKENPGKLDIHIDARDQEQTTSDKTRLSPIGSESGSMVARYLIPNPSDNSSAEDVSQDLSLDEIKNISKCLVLKSTNIALDLVQGYESAENSSKEHSKYKSKLAHIQEEKEPPEAKQKKLLRRIYDEIHVEHKPPAYPSQEKRRPRSPILTETEDAAVYEYETTDDEADDVPAQPAKKNTVIIPKPRTKQLVKEPYKETENDLRKIMVKDEKYPRRNRETTVETYSTDDLIEDIDICLTDMQSRPAAPKPKDTTLAPNPFPVYKNNLPVVCPPTTEKPQFKRKRIPHKHTVDGVDDHSDVQRTSDPLQLSRLKEVSNRRENTPEIFLRTGKQAAIPDVLQHGKYQTPLRVYQRPMGKLQPKGRDSAMVDVGVYTQGHIVSEDPNNFKSDESSLSYKSDNLPDNLTPSQRKHYSKVQCTFRAREENLPHAKFWTDIAKGNIPNRKEVTIEASSNKPIIPIGYDGLQEYDLGISKSEAELNRHFFSKVVSRPEFSKKVSRENQSSEPVKEIYDKTQKSTAVENLHFFRNMAKQPEFWSSDEVPRADNLLKSTSKESIVKSPSPAVHAVDSQENLEFFRNFSKNPDFFEKKEDDVVLPRSYFNEPPLGVEELPGRHHTKGDANLNFFLSVSRNATHFFKEPPNNLEEREDRPPTPETYQHNSGFIPDDPGNYVDEGTANDNLNFFRKLGKLDVKNEKRNDKKDGKKKKKKKVSVLEPKKISEKKAEENMQFFRDMAKQNVRHD